jgi:hypothetical protein
MMRSRVGLRATARAVVAVVVALLLLGGPGAELAQGQGVAAPTASGDSAAAIQSAVDAFRAGLGADNGTGGRHLGGRREIHWDDVPASLSSPNNLPLSYYNSQAPRGVVFATRGSGVQVSAPPSSDLAPRFGNLHPTYTALFSTYGGPRLFAPIGSTRLDASFFLPGSLTPAGVRAFGAVFSNVMTANTTGIELYDAQGTLLGEVFAPRGALSFAGGRLESPRIARVSIRAGNTPLGPKDTPPAVDVVAIAELIYGEPQAAGSGPTIVFTPSATSVPTLTVQQAIARVTASGQPGIPAAAQVGQTVTVGGAVSGTGTVTGSMTWVLSATVPTGVTAGSVPVAVLSTTQGLQGFACAAIAAGAPSVACNGTTPGNALQGSTVTVVFPGGAIVTGTIAPRSGGGTLVIPLLPPSLLPPPPLVPPPPLLVPPPPLLGAPAAGAPLPEVPVIPEADSLWLLVVGLVGVLAARRWVRRR